MSSSSSWRGWTGRLARRTSSSAMKSLSDLSPLFKAYPYGCAYAIYVDLGDGDWIHVRTCRTPKEVAKILSSLLDRGIANARLEVVPLSADN